MVKLNRRTALRTAGVATGFGLGGCLQLGPERDDCEKGRTVHDHDVELSDDHVRRRPVKPAAHSATPDVRGALRRELGRTTLSR